MTPNILKGSIQKDAPLFHLSIVFLILCRADANQRTKEYGQSRAGGEYFVTKGQVPDCSDGFVKQTNSIQRNQGDPFQNIVYFVTHFLFLLSID